MLFFSLALSFVIVIVTVFVLVVLGSLLIVPIWELIFFLLILLFVLTYPILNIMYCSFISVQFMRDDVEHRFVFNLTTGRCSWTSNSKRRKVFLHTPLSTMLAFIQAIISRNSDVRILVRSFTRYVPISSIPTNIDHRGNVSCIYPLGDEA